MLRERSQTQKAAYYTNSYIYAMPTANVCRVCAGGDKNVLEGDSGEGCTLLDILKTTDLYTFKG